MGTPAMALALPRAKRTTRSSTQSQTMRSRQDAQAKKKPARTKGTARIDKHRTKATDKAKATKSESKPRPVSEPKQFKEEAQEDPEPNTSTSTPKNVTVFTLDSELVKKPIICHQYTPSTPRSSTSHDHIPFIFTHGAGGTLSAPAVTHFCTGFSSTSSTPILAFQGSMNLGARVKAFHACREHVHGNFEAHSGLSGGTENMVMLGGRSMGARAAVIAATELVTEPHEQQRGNRASPKARLVLVSYPLQGPKDVRDQILLDLPKGCEVLFVVGDRDAMCPLELLGEVRGKMKGKSRVVVVRGADHGMDVRPKSKTREVGEETGRVAARWLNGEIEVEGEFVYVGEEE